MNNNPSETEIKKEETKLLDIIKKQYNSCMEQGICRRGIDWMVKILNQPPKKM